MKNKFYLKSQVSITDIVRALNLNVHNKISCGIEGVCPLPYIEPNFLSFSKNKQNVGKSLSGVVIGPHASGFQITSNDPRLDFIRTLNWLDQNIGFENNETPPLLGTNVNIAKSVIIEPNVIIGENSIISHGAVIKSNTAIGNNCYIGPNSIIGESGFGFERLENKDPIRFIHLGGVKIGNNVEIGANSCVDKGTLGDTIIGDHVKIDNLVQIAHNCHIGRGTMIASNAAIGGSVTIGNNCWISTAACIKNGLKLTDNAFIGIGAVVIRNIKNSTPVFGNPAVKIE